MLLELYIFFTIVAVFFFLFAYFKKQEILWAISLVFFGILMVAASSIEGTVYVFNASISAYQAARISYNYPYLIWMNGLFFVLSLVLSIFDIFDKYGRKIADDIDDGVKLK